MSEYSSEEDEYLDSDELKSLSKNPDRFAQKLSAVELRSIIYTASDLYHNGDENGSRMSDYSYDTLCFYLEKKDKAKRKRTERIGAEPREKNRCQLPFYMPSLNKVKLDRGLFEFLSRSRRFSWSLKLDGVSGMVVYEDGKVSNVFLRGNGITGGDITFVRDHIDFPELNTISDMVVRGEFVIVQ